MRQVLIYRSELLPASETFIAAQSAALERYSPWFAGLKRIPSGLELDPGRVLSLTREYRLRDKILYRAYLKSGIAPSFHRSVRAVHPSLIHAHFAVDACAALPLQLQLSVPLIVTLHGYDVMREDQALAATPAGRLFLHRREMLWRTATLFVCVSEHIRRKAIERGFPREKLSVLRIGINLPEQECREHWPTDPSLVLFTGRMVEKKGCIHLLRAMRHVEAQIPGAKVVLLGDGPLLEELKQEARKHLRNADFRGMCSPSEVRQWMRRARVLAAPA